MHRIVVALLLFLVASPAYGQDATRPSLSNEDAPLLCVIQDLRTEFRMDSAS